MTGESLLRSYLASPDTWDEMVSDGSVRGAYGVLTEALRSFRTEDLQRKHRLAADLFMNQGITFTVYSEDAGIERIFPFDIIPRIIRASEWEHIEAGIRQRLQALNLFLRDVYGEQAILKDGVVPASLIASCPQYTREVHGIRTAHDIHVHIAGIDLIRGADGVFYVLEDNLRTPSGVSYMLENREVTKRLFPEPLSQNRVRMVGNYPLLLHENLVSLATRPIANPVVVLLTPGIFNSAYYEHTFLARTMGIPSRYVSGYICPNKNGLRGVGATHAWVEAWIPGHGWAGIDPTNNVWVTDEHVPLAVGRNFGDCTPVKGTFKGPARQQLTVHVSVGYEDGHTFEEVNEVRMESPDFKNEAPPLPADHQAQQ